MIGLQSLHLASDFHLRITALRTSNKLHGVGCVVIMAGLILLCLHYACQMTGNTLLNWFVLIDNRLQIEVFFLGRMIDLHAVCVCDMLDDNTYIWDNDEC